MPPRNSILAADDARLPRSWRQNRAVLVLCGLMLALHAVIALDCARRMTVTHDEYWHLPVGVLNLQSGRFDQDNLNPPLVRVWAAIPVLLAGAKPAATDPSLDATGHGDAFLRANPREYHRLFFYGRLMIVLLSVATGVVLGVWSWEWFGGRAACLTVLLWSLSPTILANASLVTTDLGAALCYAVTLYTLAKQAEQPSWRRAVLFGICLGLAQLAKYTSLLLYPLSILLWFALRVGHRGDKTGKLRTTAVQWLVALTLSGIVLNAGYLFRGSFANLRSYHFQSESLAGLAVHLEGLQNWPVPLPKDYLEGLDRQRRIMESAHPVFLDGQWNTTGFPHYYLMALWYKLPHALQGLVLLAGVYVACPGREPRLLRRQLFLLLPFATLLLIGNLSGMQLGLRYILPVMPFLILFAGQAARWLNGRQYRFRSVVVTLFVALAFLPLRHHPHHLAFFNLLAGGPEKGMSHLLDSNIDWGQDLRLLKEYIEEHKIRQLGLAYFGTVPPDSLGIEYEAPPAAVPAPGWYAVSVNFVMGRPHTIRMPKGVFRPVGFDEFGYFRFFKPHARIGYSINVYRLSAADIRERWAARRRFLR